MRFINKVILSVSRSAVFITKFVPAYVATAGVMKKKSSVTFTPRFLNAEGADTICT